jgi:hypothetical protein
MWYVLPTTIPYYVILLTNNPPILCGTTYQQPSQIMWYILPQPSKLLLHAVLHSFLTLMHICDRRRHLFSGSIVHCQYLHLILFVSYVMVWWSKKVISQEIPVGTRSKWKLSLAYFCLYNGLSCVTSIFMVAYNGFLLLYSSCSFILKEYILTCRYFSI